MSDCDLKKEDVVLILNGSTPSIRTQLQNQGLDVLYSYKYENYEYERQRISDWFIGGRINQEEKVELVRNLENKIKNKVIKKIKTK